MIRKYWDGVSQYRTFHDIFANDEDVPTCTLCGFPNNQGPEGNNVLCSCHPYVSDRTVGAGRPKPRVTYVNAPMQPPLAINTVDGTWHFDYSVPPPPLGQYDNRPPLRGGGYPADYQVTPPEVTNNIPPMNTQPNLSTPNNGYMLLMVCHRNNEPTEIGARPPMHLANSPPGYPIHWRQGPVMPCPNNAPVSYVPHPAVNHFNSPTNFAPNPPINYDIGNRLTHPIIPPMILVNNSNMAYYNNAPLNTNINPMNPANSMPINYGINVPIHYLTNTNVYINDPNSAQQNFHNNQSTIIGTRNQPSVDTSFCPQPVECNKEEDGAWGGAPHSHRPSPAAPRGRQTNRGTTKVFHHTPGKKFINNQIVGMQGWSIVDIDLKKPLRTLANKKHVTFQNHGAFGVKLLSHFDMSTLTYFSAPDYYLGKRISSYGGNMYYLIHLEPYDLDRIVFDCDLIIKGISDCLIHEKQDHQPYKLYYRFKIPLIESVFKTMDGSRPTYTQFMDVLANVTGIYIRASYSGGISVSKLTNVSLEYTDVSDEASASTADKSSRTGAYRRNNNAHRRQNNNTNAVHPESAEILIPMEQMSLNDVDEYGRRFMMNEPNNVRDNVPVGENANPLNPQLVPQPRDCNQNRDIDFCYDFLFKPL